MESRELGGVCPSVPGIDLDPVGVTDGSTSADSVTSKLRKC